MSENNNEVALQALHITKEYKLYDSEKDRLKEAFSPFKKKYYKPFYALKDVNITINKGEKVGIIGSNGAGKSTFLKIMTEVLTPSEGTLTINGKVAALLELGAGFNPDYTGIENIRLNGKLMGLNETEINDRMQQIIDFADIGEFVKQPVKNYSSGMFVRLAFATQIFSEPDILIVDEALSVGDIRFQQKCYRAMDRLMKDKTVVLVTHDTAAVTRFCERVIWINHGQVMFDGDTTEGLKKYQEFIINQAVDEKKNTTREFEVVSSERTIEIGQAIEIPALPEDIHIKGSGKGIITHCALTNSSDTVIDIVEPGMKVKFVAQAEFNEYISHPILGITIFDRLGNIIFAINTEMIHKELEPASGKVQYSVMFTIPQLNQGEYTISPGLASGYQNDHIQLCWIDDAYSFRVTKREYDIPGFFYLDKGSAEAVRIG